MIKEMRTKKFGRFVLTQTRGILLCLVMILSSITPALTAVHQTDYVIQLSEDKAVKDAVNELMKLNPNLIVIREYNLGPLSPIWRTIGDVYIVGHGLENGMKYNNDVLSWENLATFSSKLSARYIAFVGCATVKVLDHIESDKVKAKVVGLNDKVEPVMAARYANFVNALRFDQDNAHLAYELLRERVSELIQMDKFDTLGEVLTQSYWVNQANARIVGTHYQQINNAADMDSSIRRGLTEAGSYGEMYRSYPQFYWMGMAAWVVLSVNMGKVLIKIAYQGLDILASGLSTLRGYLGTILPDVLYSAFVTLWAATVIAMQVMFWAEVLLGIFGDVLKTFFQEFVDLESVIYDHSIWAFLAFKAGGPKLVNHLFNTVKYSDPIYYATHSGDASAESHFKDHFKYVDYGNNAGTTSAKVSYYQTGASHILKYEQGYVVSNTYESYGVYTSILSFGGLVYFGPNRSGDATVINILQGDIPLAQMGNRDQRIRWAVDFLLPYFVDQIRIERNIYQYYLFNDIVNLGTSNGGYYPHPGLSIPSSFTGVDIPSGTIYAGSEHPWTLKAKGLTATESIPITYEVIWGDGTTSYHYGSLGSTDSANSVIARHTYSSTGSYKIEVRVKFTPYAGLSSSYSFTTSKWVSVSKAPTGGCSLSSNFVEGGFSMMMIPSPC